MWAAVALPPSSLPFPSSAALPPRVARALQARSAFLRSRIDAAASHGSDDGAQTLKPSLLKLPRMFVCVCLVV